jgi:hypothetical protein
MLNLKIETLLDNAYYQRTFLEKLGETVNPEGPLFSAPC